MYRHGWFAGNTSVTGYGLRYTQNWLNRAKKIEQVSGDGWLEKSSGNKQAMEGSPTNISLSKDM